MSSTGFSLQFPLREKWQSNSFGFLQECYYPNAKGESIYWGKHLGEDCVIEPGESVYPIASGKLVYSKMHMGSIEKRNWGWLVIIEHNLFEKKFYSIYGHLVKLRGAIDKEVDTSKVIGLVAPGPSAENGWWEDSHLHFAIYTGPWEGKPLVGYFREDQNYTKLEFWKDPTNFIANYQ